MVSGMFLGVGRNGAVLGHARPALGRQARRTRLAAGGGIREALAEGVQPDDAAAEPDGFVEQRGVGSERDAQAGGGEVVAEAVDVARMCGERGDVGEEVLRRAHAAEEFRERGAHARRDIGDGRARIGPQRKGPTTEGAAVVVQVGNVAGQCGRRPRRGGLLRPQGQVDLRIGMAVPELRVRPVQQSNVWNDPLAIKGSEPETHRVNDLSAVVGYAEIAGWLTAEESGRHAQWVLVAGLAIHQVRMKESFLLVRLRIA
jgi:hypothetical protein